jgi:predicted metal-binding protein
MVIAMAYDTEALVREALDAGFSSAGELNVRALVFMPEVREMCSADRCHQYNKNWRCPPGCGSIEEAAERAAQYSYGIIVQTTGHMDDDFDIDTINATSEKHRDSFAALVGGVRLRYPDMLPMGAGTCAKCEKCTYPDAPCRFPEQAISSMEAYGLWVSKVCELSGIPYYYGKLTLTYTSCYLLK